MQFTYYFYSTQYLNKVDIIILILEMKKLKFSEVKKSAEGHTLRNKAGIQKPDLLILKPDLFLL